MSLFTFSNGKTFDVNDSKDLWTKMDSKKDFSINSSVGSGLNDEDAAKVAQMLKMKNVPKLSLCGNLLTTLK